MMDKYEDNYSDDVGIVTDGEEVVDTVDKVELFLFKRGSGPFC